MANLFLIRDLCEAKKTTLKDFCSEMGIALSTLNTMMSTGRTNTATLEKLAAGLDVSPAYFYDRPLEPVERQELQDKVQALTRENELLQKIIDEKERLVLQTKEVLNAFIAGRESIKD